MVNFLIDRKKQRFNSLAYQCKIILKLLRITAQRESLGTSNDNIGDYLFRAMVFTLRYLKHVQLNET